MSITLELSPDVEARLRADAQTRGIAPEALALEALSLRYGASQSNADLDDEFDALLDSFPDNRAQAGLPPLTDEQVGRASFYEDED